MRLSYAWWETAVRVAHRRARRTGVRHRVQFTGGLWRVTPW